MEKKVNKKYYIGFLLVLLLAYLIVLSQSKGDFKVMLDAAELLRNGKNIYNVSLGDNVGLYYYSPLFALLLIPFTYVPYFIPNLLWLLASAFWVYRIWKLIQKDLDLTGFSNKQINQLIILSFLCTIRFILYNFGLIQLTVFMLWAILESLHLFEKNKNIHGSLLLALAINFKLLPIVILPYLFYRKNFQPLFLTLFFMAVYLFLPALFISKTTNSFLLYEWWGAINPAQDGFKFETDWSVHSLNALVPTLLMITEGELNLKRNILNLSPVLVNQISLAVRLLFIVFTIYFLGIKNNRPISKIQKSWEVAYLTLVIPLIFPHQHKHAFYMLFPAIVYLLYFLIFTYNNKYNVIGKVKWNIVLCLLIGSFILMTLTTDGVIGRYYNNITQHYKTVTYGAIFVAIALALSKPKYLVVNNKKDPRTVD